MKLIVALIKPFKLQEVKDALQDLRVTGMVYTEVRGVGNQKGHAMIHRGSEYLIDLVPKVKIEVAVPDHLAEAAMAGILTSAKTGKIGDGKVFVLPLEEEAQIPLVRYGELAV